MIAKRRQAFGVLSAAMAAVVIVAVGPAQAVFADSVDGGPVVTPAVSPAVSGTPNPPVTVTTIESSTATSPDSAGDPCATRSFEFDLVEAPFGWPTDAWFKMTTYWCWNGSIVTTHHTYETHGITAVGSVEGWTFNGVDPSGWYCYVAKGSARPCSGNTEYAQGNFQACLVKVGCYANWNPFIQEWENYHGGFFHN